MSSHENYPRKKIWNNSNYILNIYQDTTVFIKLEQVVMSKGKLHWRVTRHCYIKKWNQVSMVFPCQGNPHLTKEKDSSDLQKLRCCQSQGTQRHCGSRKGISIGSAPRSKFKKYTYSLYIDPQRTIPIANHFNSISFSTATKLYLYTCT